MRTIYYGKNYRVFLDNDIGRTEVTTDLFDGMPEEVIDCYYYIPAGVTWRDSDGNEHTGECIVPSKDLARFASMSKTVYAELDKPRQHFKIATVIVSGADVQIMNQVPFASGTVGAILGVQFDDRWNDLAIHAIFETDTVKRDIPVKGESVEIPSDILFTPGVRFNFGFCGYSQSDESFVIRTSVYSLGIIPKGVDCDCEKPGTPGNSVLQDLILQIGDIQKLETEDKSSLVSAINEVYRSHSSGAVNHADLHGRDQEGQHPIGAITGLADALASKQPKGNYANASDIPQFLPGAKVGDLMQIAAVDSKGVPTALKPITMEELEGKWELIETINVKASGPITRSQEPDGKPYDFKALGFKIKLGPRDPGTYIVVYVNTQPDIVGEYTLWPEENGESYYVIETSADHGVYINQLCGPANSDTKNPIINSMSYKHAFAYSAANHIINFESLVDPFLPGDIFEIWAVRA